MAAPADTDRLQQVMYDLGEVKSGTAHFSERKYTAALTEPLLAEGTLVWSAPDHIEKITTAPEPEKISVTASQLTIQRDGETHTLDLSDYPQIAGFVESIRSTLAGSPSVLRLFYDVGFEGDEANWTMTLKPTEEDMRKLVASIRISGAKGALKEIDTIATNGDRSEMTITPSMP